MSKLFYTEKLTETEQDFDITNYVGAFFVKKFLNLDKVHIIIFVTFLFFSEVK